MEPNPSKKIIRRIVGWSACLASASVFVVVLASSALSYTYGSENYGDCKYSGDCNSEISITTSGTVDLTVNPTDAGVYTTQPDSVTVDCSCVNGYTLNLQDNDSNNSLRLIVGMTVVDTISAVGASQASPDDLAANTWGYRVDGLGGFGSGPTSAQTNGSTDYIFCLPFPTT